MRFKHMRELIMFIMKSNLKCSNESPISNNPLSTEYSG